MLKIITHKSSFLPFLAAIMPYAALIAISSLGAGLYQALYLSPADYQQGEYVRIMYIHVPSAWMALAIYSFMSLVSFCYLFSGNILLNVISRELAPIGTGFAFITLATGSLWGKPTWGTWWAWDARLTFMLILFFFYVSYWAISSSLNGKIQSKAPALICIAGAVNIPIIKFSVELWNSLHQPASIIRAGGPSIHSSMLWPLGLMFIFSLSIAFIIFRLRVENFFFERKYTRHL
jgi:heme exporter protein C